MGTLHMKARMAARAIAPHRNWFPIEAFDDIRYDEAFARMRTPADELEAQRIAATDADGPLFSIVAPLFETPCEFLSDMVESVLAQTYPRFELILVNASPDRTDLRERVEGYAARDRRVRHVALDANHGITGNTNAGMAAATGDFICFIDHDDWIEPDTLFEYAAAIRANADIDMMYCDEDLAEKVKGTWHFRHPLLKQDYSPERLMCTNYVIHFLAVRKAIIDDLPVAGGEFDGAQDFNLTLAAAERARAVHHVARVLYHFRMSEASTAANPAAKPYRIRAARLSIQGHLERTGTQGTILGSKVAGTHTIWFRPKRTTKVSVVVADSAEGGGRHEAFLEAFAQVNTYENVEIIFAGPIGDDGKGNPHAMQARFIACPEDAGLYERLNRGASTATGDVLVFLDSNCAFVTPEPIEQLLGLLAREGVGVVAPKTLFADYSLKAYGIGVSGEGIVPLYRGYTLDYPSYLGCLYAHQNTHAVGYQGLSTRRSDFESLGGFDAAFGGELGSVDYCQRVIGTGRRIALSCNVEALTHEDPPRQPFAKCGALPDFPPDDIERFFGKWPAIRSQADPYRNPRLDLKTGYPVFRL